MAMTQCKATTKKGAQCKRSVKQGSNSFCSIHSKQRTPRMANHQERDRQEQSWLKHFLNAYQSWAQRLCIPVFWRNADRQMHNGTITLVRTPSLVLGITNAHVADGLLADYADEPGRGCQIGGAHFNPDRL